MTHKDPANDDDHVFRFVGKGDGPLVSPEEGKRRLDAASRRIPVESWAGPLADGCIRDQAAFG